MLAGMYTSELNAETLEEISYFMLEHKEEYADKKLILYGNIPGLAYYLDMAPAIDTIWADLDTYSVRRFREGLAAAGAPTGQESVRPLVILTPLLSAWISGDQEVMEWWGIEPGEWEQDEKLTAIRSFMEEQTYRQVFANEAFVVYD